jgi:hypothetical protein
MITDLLSVTYLLFAGISGIAWLVALVVILLPRPIRSANFLLATVSAVNLATNVLFAADLVMSDRSRWVDYNATLQFVVLPILSTSAYLAFLGVAIDSPVTSWLSRRYAQVTLAIAAAGFVIFCYADAYRVIVPLAQNPGEQITETSAFTIDVNVDTARRIAMGVVLALSLVASLDALRRARGSPQKRQKAKGYLLAFACNDLAALLGALPGFSFTINLAESVGALVLTICFVLFLLRALVRDQLFDFDVKLKWTLKRGTLVAIILGTFFVVSALAEQYLQQFGWVFGGLAVGALLFALRPIERAIDRLADRAMPKTTGTPEYLAQRKHEIYRAAVEEATRGGSVSVKERRLLLRLAGDLEIPADEAMRLESDVLEATA